MLCVGEGSNREQWCLLHSLRFSVTPSTTHNQIGPFWCYFSVGWVCVCSRTLWISPRNSPVRLGVYPAAPTIVFNQRFEALFPRAGALSCTVCFAPCHSSRFIYARMWDHLVCTPPPGGVCQALPCPPQSSSRHLASSPPCPAAHLRPSYQSG